jgi:hypothetical protein
MEQYNCAYCEHFKPTKDFKTAIDHCVSAHPIMEVAVEERQLLSKRSVTSKILKNTQTHPS